MSQKKAMRWFLINFGFLGAFIIGNINNIPVITLIGEIGLWIAALVGTLILIIIDIHHNNPGLFYNKTYIVEKKEDMLKFKKELSKEGDTKTLLLEKDMLYALSSGSVPIWIDICFDLITAMIMIYFGYAWLPVLYLFHIVGGYKLRMKSKKTYESAKIFDIEKYKAGVKETQ
jgi:uncharacterized membrane protein